MFGVHVRGLILVSAIANCRGIDIQAAVAGVNVTLIDFTLSRLQTGQGEVAFCDLAVDPELFKGPKGDIQVSLCACRRPHHTCTQHAVSPRGRVLVQAETYRRMQKVTRGDWRQHAPATNALWLHYLADIMLNHKLPQTACTGDERLQLRNFRKRASHAAAAADLVWDDLFAEQWTSHVS